MKTYRLMAVGSLMLAAASVQAIELDAEIGRHFTGVSAGMGTSTPGLAVSGSLAHSRRDGNVFGVGLGYNLALGSAQATLGTRALYLNPEHSKDGVGVALGGGLSIPWNNQLSLYGEGYIAPESLVSSVQSYTEAKVGIRWDVVRSVNLATGYRYIHVEGSDQRPNNTLADGIYASMGLNF